MDFLAFFIQAILSRKKNSKLIIIQAFFFIKTVVPDEAALLTVLGNCRITHKVSVLMYGIHIKEKNTFRIQIVIYQTKYLKKFFSLRDIIQAVTHTDHRTYRTI